jgi:hypothetical protein
LRLCARACACVRALALLPCLRVRAFTRTNACAHTCACALRARAAVPTCDRIRCCAHRCRCPPSFRAARRRQRRAREDPHGVRGRGRPAGPSGRCTADTASMWSLHGRCTAFAVQSLRSRRKAIVRCVAATHRHSRYDSRYIAVPTAVAYGRYLQSLHSRYTEFLGRCAAVL